MTELNHTRLELINRLDHHDFFFEMSDDYRVWKAGNENWKAISSLATQLGQEGTDIINSYKVQ